MHLALDIHQAGKTAEGDRVVSRTLQYAVAAALIVSSGAAAFAASAPAAETAAQKTADKDFGKVSSDGHGGLLDIRLTRLDIFDGHIDRAKTDLAKAMTALNKAQSDETVFTKAEADLKPPAAMQGKTQPPASASATPVEWLPVDGAMTLGEDYVATPEKAAGVNKADQKLAKGDHAGAIDELKIAHVDVDFLLEVAPLKATMNGVKQASDELNAGKYYEANQSLKSVEDGMRFDSQTLVATPQKTAATAKSSG